MLDLVCRAIERFLLAEAVLEVQAGLSPGQMLYDAAWKLGKTGDELAEDLGGWLVRQNEIWRLLRFCGSDFLDFLLHLDELPERVRLIAEDADIPDITLLRDDGGMIWVTLSNRCAIWTAVFSGLLRGMADDYGTLCVITRGQHGISVDVSEAAFAQARTFCLSPRTGAA